MSYRFMRILVFFDLPTITVEDRREYSKFRRYLIKNGFVMLQESVYYKIVLNQTAVNVSVDSLRKNRPKSGFVMSLVITEKQFEKCDIIAGEFKSDIISDDRRFIVL